MRSKGTPFLTCAMAGCAAVALTACLGSNTARVEHSGPAVFASAVSSQDALLKLADRFAERRNYAAAIPLYRRAHDIDRGNAEAALGLGRALAATGRYEEALTVYRGTGHRSPEILAAEGSALIALERPGEALGHFRTALKQHDAARLHEGRAMALDALGRHGEAVKSFQQALMRAPDDLRIRNNYGLSLAIHGETEEAVPLMEIVAADPRAGAKHRQNLALTYGLAGRFDEAAKISSVDLDSRAVRDNVAYFAELRAQNVQHRRMALLAGARPQASDLAEPANLVFRDVPAPMADRGAALAAREAPEPAPETSARRAAPQPAVTAEALPAIEPAHVLIENDRRVSLKLEAEAEPLSLPPVHVASDVRAPLIWNQSAVRFTAMPAPEAAQFRAQPIAVESDPRAPLIWNQSAVRFTALPAPATAAPQERPQKRASEAANETATPPALNKTAATERIITIVDDHGGRIPRAKPATPANAPEAATALPNAWTEAIYRQTGLVVSPVKHAVQNIRAVFSGE